MANFAIAGLAIRGGLRRDGVGILSKLAKGDMKINFKIKLLSFTSTDYNLTLNFGFVSGY